MGQINNFQELEVWQKAHRLVLAVYQATKAFPADVMVDAESISRLLYRLIESINNKPQMV